MNKNILIGIGVFIFTAIVYWMTSISYYNGFNTKESDLVTAKKETQNIHASIYKKMKNIGIVDKRYEQLVIEALEVTVKNRKTAGAAMVWIQEKYPDINIKTKIKLQQVIEASFNQFKSGQTKVLDMYNNYYKYANSYFGSHFAKSHGFPKKSWEELGRIVTSKVTKRDFATGELSDPEL